MAKKRKPATKKRGPNQIAELKKSNEDQAAGIARVALRPTVLAAITLAEYGKSHVDLDLSGLVDSLTEQTKAVTDGDLNRGEAMLTVQAHTLDAIFNSLAQRAINAEYMDHLDSYLKLALRAQSQCRATWETLATIKNPPMMGYVKQANIAQGHQQVNNGTNPVSEAARTRENKNPQNKLLEGNHGERLDTRATGTAGGIDPEMAAVGEVDRTKDAGG